MYSSIMGVALAAALAPSNATLAPAWLNDYRSALEQGGRDQKPVVVVIGSGKTPWANLAQAAEQDETINRTLRRRYVCLFVDTDTTEGQQLARSFDMDKGLVISDRSGERQAYRQAGELPTTQVARTLTTYSGTAPAAAPVAAPAPVYYPQQPAFYPSFGGFGGGGCPSCRR